MSNVSINSDAELKAKVRALTGYADDEDELPAPALDGIVEVAKLNLQTETGSTSWYTDAGLGQALLGVTCVRAKERVENYSVSSWTIGDQTIDVRNAGDAEQAQFQQWAQMVSDGISSSDAVTDTGLGMSNTSSYTGER